MNDLSLQAAVVVNSEQAETAFDRVGDKAQQMANEVSTSATKAGQAVDKIGDGAGASAEKFTRAESRISASIKRATTELELLGKTASQRLEFNIADKGLDASKFEPALKKLREIEAQALQAQRAATGSLDSMGMSAKATAAAMRGVPAQFQDIIVSLQGGQAPMTVLLQQGSQLSGMFGGAGNAAKALGGYIMGLINPFTLAAAAVAGLGIAMASINGKDAALLALSTQLTGTGRASAAAVGDIKALVKELNLVPGVSKASATAIITEFAKVSGIGGELFKSLGASVADFAAATGTDLPTAAKKLADAFADPAKGAQALEGALGTLTAAQILTIEKMAAMGDKSGAQVAMMDALKQATEGLAKQGMTPLGEATDKMSNAWDALTSSIGNSEAFRTANSWLATLIEKVAELTVRLSQMKPPTWLQFLPVVGPAIGTLTMAAGASSGSRSVSGVVGTWDEGGATGSWGPTASETEQQVKAAIAATRGYETQSAAMEKLRGVASQAKDALKELESQNRGGSVEAMRLRDSIAAMNEKLADMGKKGAPKGPAKETISEYDKLIKKLSDELPKAAAEAEAAQMGYNKAQTEFLALAGSPAWASFSNAQRAVVASMFEGKIASEEAGEAAKALSKSYAEAAAERIKTIQSMERAADSLQSQNDALRDEIELIGLSTDQQTLVLQQRNDVIILTKEATLAELERQSAITGTQTRVEIALASEIAALKERNALLGAKGVKNAAVDAAKSAADEWQKTSDKINDTLTDALMRGFESGKDFAKNLRDTVINMFKTMVLRPVISAIVNPIAGAVTGALGFSGAANAATGGGGIMGMASNASSAYNLVSGGGAFAGALGSGFTMGMGGLGSMGVALEGGAAMLGSATGVSSALAGIGQIAGALGPIALGIGAIAGLASLFGSKSTQEYGAVANYSAASGLQTAKGGYENNAEWRNFGTGFGGVAYEQGIATQVSSITQSIVMALDATAKTFGQTVGYEAAAGFASDFGDEATWGGLRIALQGMDLVNWDNNRQSKWAPKEFSSGEEGYKQYLAAIAKDTRQVLLDMDLPSWADTMLESIGEAASMDQLSTALQQIGAIKATFTQLGQSMAMFAGITGGMESSLLRAAGSIDALASSASSYYDAVYTEQEKLDRARTQLETTLGGYGATLPATREQYRALVEQQFAAGEAGAEFAVVLMGLAGTFGQVVDNLDSQFAELEKSASDMFAPLLESIKQARGGVDTARSSIIGSEAMTASQIASAIGAAMVYAPSSAGVAGAQGAAASAAAQVAARKSAAETAQANASALYGGLQSAVVARDGLMAQKAAVEKTKAYWEDWMYQVWEGTHKGYSYGRRKMWSNEATEKINEAQQQLDALQPSLTSYTAAVAAQQAVYDAAQGAANGYAQQLAAAQAALATAQQAEVQARADYAAQINTFVTAAGTSVGKLGSLREEVVRYYEAQAEAVQSMIATAENLRNVVGSIRMGQLDSAQTASQLGSSYASDYSMALATTGTTRAGYADSMAATLPTLAEAIKAESSTASDWRVQTGKLLAQATGVAGMLEADAAGSDYQTTSLGLLDSIDTALAQLEGSTKSAEQVIAQAINDGTASQLTGLRAIVAALRGESVPAFATGGSFGGGIRLVGENGPELEVTGPSRIYSASQTAAMLSGGGNANAALVAELRALRADNQAQAAAMVNMQRELNKLMLRWDSQGMPEERIV